jgi:flagellar hook assembly protein FlgD
LTDLNKTPLSKQKVNITVKDSKGKVVANKTVKTNSKGKATFKIKKLTKKGKHTATVKYAGNGYFNKVSKNVKITVN